MPAIKKQEKKLRRAPNCEFTKILLIRQSDVRWSMLPHAMHSTEAFLVEERLEPHVHR